MADPPNVIVPGAWAGADHVGETLTAIARLP